MAQPRAGPPDRLRTWQGSPDLRARLSAPGQFVHECIDHSKLNSVSPILVEGASRWNAQLHPHHLSIHDLPYVLRRKRSCLASSCSFLRPSFVVPPCVAAHSSSCRRTRPDQTNQPKRGDRHRAEHLHWIDVAEVTEGRQGSELEHRGQTDERLTSLPAQDIRQIAHSLVGRATLGLPNSNHGSSPSLPHHHARVSGRYWVSFIPRSRRSSIYNECVFHKPISHRRSWTR